MDYKTPKRDVIDELDYDPSLDKADIGVSCQDGIVTLRGEAAYLGQKYAAEKAATRTRGVRAIANKIDIKSGIKNALRRNTNVEADRIHVIVQDGGTVVLQGNVNNWHEREIAAEAAWAVSGVTDVVDQLTIG